jgi:hypothetical protein
MTPTHDASSRTTIYKQQTLPQEAIEQALARADELAENCFKIKSLQRVQVTINFGRHTYTAKGDRLFRVATENELPRTLDWKETIQRIMEAFDKPVHLIIWVHSGDTQLIACPKESANPDKNITEQL